MFDEIVSHIQSKFDGRLIIKNDFNCMIYGFLGYHDSKENKIVINPETEYNGFRTLFHELAHATGMPNRLNRGSIALSALGGAPTKLDRKIEETIADTVAIKLMFHFNVMDGETLKLHEEYLINNFTGRNVDYQVNEAFDYILNNWLVGFEVQKQDAA